MKIIKCTGRTAPKTGRQNNKDQKARTSVFPYYHYFLHKGGRPFSCSLLFLSEVIFGKFLPARSLA